MLMAKTCQSQEKPNDHGYSWKRDKFLIVRDHNNRMSNDQIDLLT